MTLFFFDDFETDDFSLWDTDSSGADLFTSAASALAGSFGCEIDSGCAGCGNEVILNLNAFSLGAAFRVGFKFDRNDISLTSGQYISLVLVVPFTLTQILEIRVINDGGTLKAQTIGFDDSDVEHSAESAITSGIKEIEARLVSATGAATNDGSIEIYVNGALIDSATGIDNHTKYQDLVGGSLSVRPELSSGDANSGSFYVDDFTLRDDDTPIFTGDVGSYVIGTAIDNETDGDTAWLTVWRDGTMYLQRWDIPTLTKELEITLGESTLAQVQARNQVAYPFAGSDQKMWVFGNMVQPAYLTGTVHLAETTGAGASGTWAISPNLSSWDSADVLDSLYVTPDLDGIGTRRFTAIRRRGSNAPELWQGLNALTLVSALPFPNGTSIEYRGMHIGRGGGIAVGVADVGTGSNRLVSSISPYTSWTDITYNYPSGTVQVLRYL